MVEPVAFFVALNFGERSLVGTELLLRFDFKGLLLGLYGYLALAFVSIFVFLFP